MRVVTCPKKPWKQGRPPEPNPKPFLVLSPVVKAPEPKHV
jgi:hypothetical protein